MSSVSQALEALAPNATFRVIDDDWEQVDWMSPEVPIPSKEAVEAKIKELAQAYKEQEYARQREAEYPSIKELVVALYDTEDKAAIDAKRAEIKKKYPKGDQ